MTGRCAAACTDLTAAFVALPLLVQRGWLRFAIAGAAPLLLYAGWNLALTGSPLPVQMQAELYRYPGSIFLDAQGLAGASIPHASPAGYLGYLFNATLGSRSALLLSPITLLGLVGLALRPRWHGHALAAVVLLIVGTTLGSDNYAGDSFGFRWHLPALPLLMLGCVTLIEVGGRVARWSGVVASTAGLAIALAGSIDPFVAPRGGDSPLVAQFSGDARYTDRLYDNALYLVENGKNVYAPQRLQSLLRRASDDLRARQLLSIVELALERDRPLKLVDPVR